MKSSAMHNSPSIHNNTDTMEYIYKYQRGYQKRAWISPQLDREEEDEEESERSFEISPTKRAPQINRKLSVQRRAHQNGQLLNTPLSCDCAMQHKEEMKERERERERFLPSSAHSLLL
jgi:hypothetical protein